ncbi:MAG TPA: ATPase [Bacteroidales bacterium]|jgi:N-acetylglucosamine kinase-like BadF-type ATPase|nr:ATPase [Proteiniphilum sp.]HHT35139.1 ATPase [Bacteroidales bacterium]MDD3333023.1 ATPase [Proteiniphilum sp.]MDD4486017.1 ATPase [Proteiniphilum sp.]MDD5345893.1 ATPase [Proteiniphilum sp.]
MNQRTARNILIADSGATKTDWCLAHDGEILQRFSGTGISPVYQTEEEIAEEIRLQVMPHLKESEIHSIHFYGSGCIPGKTILVENALYHSFPIGDIHVYSDLIAAAHSLCGHNAGIACIMGTGSNSCEWNGSEVIAQVSPLGFILGDEGSGAALGRQLLGDALKNQLTPGLREKMLEELQLTPSLIIDKVYRQPFPSRFLASLAPFLLNNIADKSIRRIVSRGFSDFFERNVMQYDYRKQEVHFVGSIARHFSDILREVAADKEIVIGKIEQSPMNGLINFLQ